MSRPRRRPRPVATDRELVGRAAGMRTYVRDRSRADPARRPRLVLCLGRAARQPAPARPAGHRRRRRGAGGQLRGEGLRGPVRDGRPAGPRAVPGGRRRAAADERLLGGEQGGLRGLRRHHPARGGPVHRRGVPRRRRAGTRLRVAGGDRGPAAPARCASEVGLPITVGVARTKFLAKVASAVAKPDGLLFVPRRPGARLPAPAAGRAAVGRRGDHRGEAARARHHDRRRGRRRSTEARAGVHARARVRAAPARTRPQP